MKKNILKTIARKATASILTIVMLAYSMCIFASAEYTTEDDEGRYNQNCSTYYYYSLTSNFGLNREGTCAYVATAMLLSYYDNYLSDDFIPDKYVSNGSITINSTEININYSPGIIQEIDWYTSGFSTYNDFIDAYASEYFQLKLIQMGRDDNDFYLLSNFGNILDFLGFDRIVDENITPNIDWSISIVEAAELVEGYLAQQGLSDSVDVYCESYKDYLLSLGQEGADDYIREKVIEKVVAGTPVVYAGFYQNENTNQWSGHALVAFDYDSEADKLIFHTGWNSNPIIREDDENFQYYDRLYMMWLEVDSTQLSHNNNVDSENYNCANNYIVTEGTSQSNVCMCSFDVHPNHVHSLKDDYSGYSSSGHYFDCKWCDYSLLQSHTYLYKTYSSTHHRSVCSCGYTRLSAHVIRDTEATILRCIYCNAIVESGGGAVIMSLNTKKYITDNGSYIRSDGIIVISDADYELYLMGDLNLEEFMCENVCNH